MDNGNRGKEDPNLIEGSWKIPKRNLSSEIRAAQIFNEICSGERASPEKFNELIRSEWFENFLHQNSSGNKKILNPKQAEELKEIYDSAMKDGMSEDLQSTIREKLLSIQNKTFVSKDLSNKPSSQLQNPNGQATFEKGKGRVSS